MAKGDIIQLEFEQFVDSDTQAVTTRLTQKRSRVTVIISTKSALLKMEVNCYLLVTLIKIATITYLISKPKQQSNSQKVKAIILSADLFQPMNAHSSM